MMSVTALQERPRMLVHPPRQFNVTSLDNWLNTGNRKGSRQPDLIVYQGDISRAVKDEEFAAFWSHLKSLDRKGDIRLFRAGDQFVITKYFERPEPKIEARPVSKQTIHAEPGKAAPIPTPGDLDGLQRWLEHGRRGSELQFYSGPTPIDRAIQSNAALCHAYQLIRQAEDGRRVIVQVDCSARVFVTKL